MSYNPYQGQIIAPGPYRCSETHVVIAWVVAVLTGLYMLPWAIAATRNKTNVAAIAVIDALLGWTVIGWVAALVMACTSETSQSGVMIVNTQMMQYAQPPMPYRQPVQSQMGYQQRPDSQHYGQPALPQSYRQSALPPYGHSPYEQVYPSGDYDNQDAQHQPFADPWHGQQGPTLHNADSLR